ncbi:MAG: 50S ribosomal protein L5 [Clostridia bacterium]
MAKNEAQNAPQKKKKQAEEAKPFTEPARLRARYKEIIPELSAKFNYKNIMDVPRLEKIVLNMGLGAEKDNPKGIENAVEEMALIAGQRPIVTKAKKSVANFKVRQGMNIGAKVTLRSDKMYYFADKLINIVLPRVRDFRGVSDSSFDGRGNYAMGVKEQLIFPEINYDDVDKTRGMDIVFVTTAKTDEEAKELLRLLGMPFAQA